MPTSNLKAGIIVKLSSLRKVQFLLMILKYLEHYIHISSNKLYIMITHAEGP